MAETRSTAEFLVKKHIIPAAHTRGLERAVRDEDAHNANTLRLAVNQYIPKRNPNPQPGDLTLIFAHGIQSAKECYEPLFDDMLRAVPRDTRPPIRSIWISDMYCQCESFLLNENIIGDVVDMVDYSRDIWQMINHLQSQMPPPLVGLGQSYGFGWMALVSSFSPRLFSGLIGLEAGLGPIKSFAFDGPKKYFPGRTTSVRRDHWESRDDARAYLRKRPYYSLFEERVFEKFLEFELRDEAEIGQNSTGKCPVTLTTPKNIETAFWGYPDPPLKGYPKHREDSIDRAHVGSIPGVMATEGYRMWDAVGKIFPPVLYVHGKAKSSVSDMSAGFVKLTGTDVGGNGGVKSGKVTEKWVEGTHIISLEKPQATGRAAMEWLLELKVQLDAEREERKKAPPFLPHGTVHPELLERYSRLGEESKL